MTILPKLKSGSAPKKSSSRDVVVVAGQNSRVYDHQAVASGGTGQGWAASVVAPSSSATWSGSGPPVVAGPSSSPLWVSASSGAGNSGNGAVVLGGQEVSGQTAKKKRPAPSPDPGNFFAGFDQAHLVVDNLNGPTTSKRGRHRGVAAASVVAAAAAGAGMTVVGRKAGGGMVGSPSTLGGATNPRPPEEESGGLQSQSLPQASTSGGGANRGEGGYNSEDEYSHLGCQLTEEEWLEKDRKFERTMKKKGYVIKGMVEDGSCLFRAVADQIYGDEEMHACVRAHCMDYIEQNGDYFSQYMTEDLSVYVERKRFLGVHGNHLEIQALSEMYNRPIHIYCYSSEPINIFQATDKSDHLNAPPIRLCYHRGVHYNSLVDPQSATIGVGLGLPNYSPGSADRNLVRQAVSQSERDVVEKTMLEDKIRATDWEATNEAIEEQVARESYLQWLRDNERRNGGSSGRNHRPAAATSATVTSGELSPPRHVVGGGGSTEPEPDATSPPKASSHNKTPPRSPVPGCSSLVVANPPRLTNRVVFHGSPKAGCSSEQQDRFSPEPGSSSGIGGANRSGRRSSGDDDDSRRCSSSTQRPASFFTELPPSLFGLDDWGDADVISKVLAASQQEYLDSLKINKNNPAAAKTLDKKCQDDDRSVTTTDLTTTVLQEEAFMQEDTEIESERVKEKDYCGPVNKTSENCVDDGRSRSGDGDDQRTVRDDDGSNLDVSSSTRSFVVDCAIVVGDDQEGSSQSVEEQEDSSGGAIAD